MARCDEEWRESLDEFGDIPRPDERFRQETSLFGFYVAAVSVIDCFCFSVFAAAALARPENFNEVVQPDEQWSITRWTTSTRLSKFYPNAPLTERLKGTVESTDCKRIFHIRNVLAHRLAPLREYTLDEDLRQVLSSGMKLEISAEESTAVAPPLTAQPRAWLSGRLAALTHDMAAFVRELQTIASSTDQIRTQRVTAVDLAYGRIRLPHLAKGLFPPEKGRVRVVLRGEALEVGYDPRFGPVSERSAVLRIGRKILGGLVTEDEVLAVRALPDGLIEFA
jgi:hypothetical protein